MAIVRDQEDPRKKTDNHLVVPLLRGALTLLCAKSAETHVSHPCLLYTSPSPRDRTRSRMPSSA